MKLTDENGKEYEWHDANIMLSSMPPKPSYQGRLIPIKAEPDWRDDLSKGKRIPCIVWDDGDAEDEKNLDHIISYTKGAEYPYVGKFTYWEHATPIQEKDCWRAE